MKADRQAPIGVFDSGVGGLTVVREIMRNLPDERIVYFGDTARVPYGSKSKNTVIRYSRQIVHFLETQQVKAIVIACNTASALALDTIEKEIDLPIIGVVKPGAQMAVEMTQNKRVGVIATESTIQSGLYQQLITEADPAITVYGKPCPLFVPLVEEGWTKDPITRRSTALPKKYEIHWLTCHTQSFFSSLRRQDSVFRSCSRRSTWFCSIRTCVYRPVS